MTFKSWFPTPGMLRCSALDERGLLEGPLRLQLAAAFKVRLEGSGIRDQGSARDDSDSTAGSRLLEARDCQSYLGE